MLGGWSALARGQRRREQFRGKRWRFRSGRMGLVSYNSCLTLGSDPRGLFLAVLFPFRIGHPPLFIPWSDVEASTDRVLFFPVVRLTFRQEPSVSLTLSRGMGRRLAAESKGGLSLGEPMAKGHWVEDGF